jgi:hypothetical protein
VLEIVTNRDHVLMEHVFVIKVGEDHRAKFHCVLMNVITMDYALQGAAYVMKDGEE